METTQTTKKISRLNRDKRIVNEYEYSQEPTLGGILITRIR